MRNPSLKFQNHILEFEWTEGWMDRRTDGQTQSNMPLQLYQSWGHNDKRRLKGF